MFTIKRATYTVKGDNFSTFLQEVCGFFFLLRFFPTIHHLQLSIAPASSALVYPDNKSDSSITQLKL